MGVNPLSVDPDVSGVIGRYGPVGNVPGGQAPYTQLERARLIRQRYLNVDAAPAWSRRLIPAVQKVEAWEAMDQATKQANAALAPTADEITLAGRFKQSQEMEAWAARLNPRRAEENIPFFSRHVVDDWLTNAAALHRQGEAANAVHNLFADVALPSTQAGPGWLPVNDALKRVGFDDVPSAQNELMSRLGGKFGNVSPTQLYVPPEGLADAKRFLQGFQTPEVLKPLTAAVDWMTNLTKAFQSAVWPSTPAKYVVQAGWQNFVLGAHDPRHNPLNPLAWIQPYQDATSMMRGGTIEGAAGIPFLKNMGLTDAEATKKLADLASQYGAAGGGGRGVSALTGGEQADKLKDLIPGMNPAQGFGSSMNPLQGMIETGRSAIPGSLAEANPLNIAGVNAEKDVFAPVKAMREASSNVDEAGRLAGFVAKMRPGIPSRGSRQGRQRGPPGLWSPVGLREERHAAGDPLLRLHAGRRAACPGGDRSTSWRIDRAGRNGR